MARITIDEETKQMIVEQVNKSHTEDVIQHPEWTQEQVQQNHYDCLWDNSLFQDLKDEIDQQLQDSIGI